jgi:predicted P-loop ATPase
MIAHVTDIDWGYTSMEVDQIWAQAYDLYLSGESWNLKGIELDQVNQINDSYQVTDLVLETVLALFDIDPKNSSWWMSTVDIMNRLKDPAQGNLKGEVDTRKLAAAMTKIGLGKPSVKRTGKTLARGYTGIKLKGP